MDIGIASVVVSVVNIVPAVIIAIATVIYVWFTRQMVKETKALRMVQINPKISLYLDTTPWSLGFIVLKLVNDGFGGAYDLEFEYNTKDCHESIVEVINKTGHLSNGIKYLPNGQQISTFYTSLYQIDIYELLMKSKPNVVIKYRNIYGEIMSGSFVLDLGIFRHLSQLERWESQIVKSLASIKDSISKFATNSNRAHVVIHTANDIKEEQDAWRQWQQEYIVRNKD